MRLRARAGPDGSRLERSRLRKQPASNRGLAADGRDAGDSQAQPASPGAGPQETAAGRGGMRERARKRGARAFDRVYPTPNQQREKRGIEKVSRAPSQSREFAGIPREVTKIPSARLQRPSL